MSEFLAGAAAALGVPEALVKRSAEARAKASGVTVDQVLQAWAGGGDAPAAAIGASGAAPSADNTSAGYEPAAAAPPTPAGQAVAAAAAITSPAVVRAAPAPTEVTPQEALRYPAVVTIPTAGLAERPVAAIPRWLAVAFLVLPLFGLLQLASASNDCGSATELAPDRVTGTLRNCDGSPFEGRGTPGGSVDFVALGGDIFSGQVVSTANCAGCHGPQGQGGVGPALSGVSSTFASCADHIEWVTKGSSGLQAEGRTTYGDLNKPITANMPSFAASLSVDQIATVVAFERVRFAAGDSAAVLADCGLVASPEEASTTTGAGAPAATTAAP